MRQMIKRFLWMVLLTGSSSALFAFSLDGPVGNGGDAWQSQANGFNPLVWSTAFGILDGNADGPKNLGEEYRFNAPVLYYACDANFLDFFGMSGLMAVEQAFVPFNNLTNVDNFSSSLSEFPLQSEAVNYTAQSWGLYDLKSLTMALIVGQIGLADAVRYTWVLHDRWPGIPPCPVAIQYLVSPRNYDLLSPLPAGNGQFYSPFVNATLYTYYISEYCGASPPSPLTAAAVAENLDPAQQFQNPPVASGVGIAASGVVPNGAYGHLLQGGYYTGLTRDDVQGLRYLYSTNNVNTEAPAAGSLVQSYDFNATQLLSTTNLFALSLASQTTPPAALQAQFPGLVISSVSNYYALVVTPTIISYQTNLPGSPYGSLENVVQIILTTNIQQFYAYTFGNIVIQSYSTNTRAILQTTQIGPANGSPFGSPSVTKVTSRNIVVTNIASGDYYFFPAGTCGYNFVQTLQTNVIAVTNNLIAATNGSLSLTENLITFFTNHIYVVAPCSLVAPTPRLYQGVQKLQFVQANYDSLLGQYFQPVTNNYSMVLVTNHQPVRQYFQRVVTGPNFIFSAADLTAGPAANPVVNLFSRTLPAFVADPGYTGLAGPGVINPNGSTISFNKSSPVYGNQGTAMLQGTNYGRTFAYATFDGTTNLPVVYPDAASTAKLEAAVLIQVSPSSPGGLVDGFLSRPYSATISAAGGQSPCVWSLAHGQLPDGLSLSTTSATSCAISGTPTRRGTFYFTIQMTDSSSPANTLNWDYYITIN
jgi:hypothetical protein